MDSRSPLPLVLAVVLILLATLMPGAWTSVEGSARGHDRLVADILLNIILFMPFGAALGYRGSSAVTSLLTGALFSGMVELAQMAVPGRESGLRDVLCNTLGAVGGWMLYRSSRAWILPNSRAAGRMALFAAVLAGALVVLTGFLLSPWLPQTTYYGGWMHQFGHLQVYRGKVFEATVGDLDVPSGPIPHSSQLRDRLLAGSTLRLRGLAGPPVPSLAPLLSIHDQYQREVLLLGVDREDIVYRFATRAVALGLDRPELRAPGVMRDLRQGDPLTITVVREHTQYCIGVNTASTCGLGFTIGAGWALLLYSQGFPPASHLLWNAAWMMGLTLPSGYWARRTWHSAVAVALLVPGLTFLPTVTGLASTPSLELGAAMCGFLGGAALARLLATSRSGLPLSGPRSPSRGN